MLRRWDSPCAARTRTRARGANTLPSSASRAVFAMMEAAMISGTVASPLTMALLGMPHAGQNRPSTSTRRGRTARACTARRMARSVALWMFSASISAWDAQPMLQATARALMTAAAAVLSSGSRAFESSRMSRGKSAGRMTAAAVTGPASGPRPASSTPQESSQSIISPTRLDHPPAGMFNYAPLGAVH